MLSSDNPRHIAVIYPGRTSALIMPVNVTEAFDPNKAPNTYKSGRYTAIWDTGASCTCINSKIVNDLKLKPIDIKKMSTAGGIIDSNIYLVNIGFPSDLVKSGVRVAEGNITGTDVLIGMDIITDGDFVITNVNNKTIFSFQLPSTGKLDYHSEIPPEPSAPLPLKILQKVGRNDPCPCGSGKKYKKCHGA